MFPQPMCGMNSCSVPLFSRTARTNDIAVTACTNHNNMLVPLKTTDGLMLNILIKAKITNESIVRY